ncbi:methylenetetrahydrofolate reductase [NAD(P)H] [Salinibacter sp. 10B]|uniref:methylenetetrahydrofolate reductase [NAD(P)H] n=1 Tax=Salinibacter sp. 10B TaxID=1923971 RepID=UPI000CF4D733|nr:methylenetetrahydrofolate reductase [NAD(P)H] [Salinibacter sp. 10B]PQJ35728.1 methylenetetrahydrofolate reductase [NAD(P)H] [Salinibacter sp. 10B]
MKVTEHLERASDTLISYEIIPPKRGGSAEQMLDVVEELMPFDPPFIDVTSHSAEVSYEQTDDGTWERCIERKRPGTLGLCAAIEARFDIDTVPHLLCRGFTREETEDALIELNYLGIDNVLGIRGDETGFKKPIDGGRSRNEYAVDLVRQIEDMNNGRYLEDLKDAEPTDFCIGVGGYPETHFEAPNLTWDIMRLKQKVEAGADYIVTQMFFDNDYFFEFVEKCRDVGIEVPIIPGVKILKRKSHLRLLPKYFHTEIPEELTAEVDAAEPEDVEKIGVDWAIQQTEELMEAGVPCIHFYIMSSAQTVKKVVEPLRETA